MIDLSTWPTKLEAAERLGISERTLDRMTVRENLDRRFRKRFGKRDEVVYNPADIEARMPKEAAATVLPPEPAAAPAAVERRPPAGDSLSFLRDIGEFLSRGIAAAAGNAPAGPATLFYTLAEASGYLGLSEAFLRRLVARGGIPAVRDRGWKIRKADLDAFASSGAGAATNPTKTRENQMATAKTKPKAKPVAAGSGKPKTTGAASHGGSGSGKPKTTGAAGHGGSGSGKPKTMGAPGHGGSDSGKPKTTGGAAKGKR